MINAKKKKKKEEEEEEERKIEEDNRMGKTKDLFKKHRDTKGIFHAKMGTLKDRNSMACKREGRDDLTKP